MAAITKGKYITAVARLSPPGTLSPAAKMVYAHTVNSVDPSHFSEVDAPLLEAYAQSAALATEAARKLDADGAVTEGRPSPWLSVSEKAIKQLVALSARLRICPQSRFDRLGAGSNSRPQPDAPRAGKRGEWDDLIAR